MLETSALETLYIGQSMLSIQLIKPNYLEIHQLIMYQIMIQLS